MPYGSAGGRPMQPFLRSLSLTIALGAVSATTACDRHGDYGDKHDHHGAILSDADAAKITDATVATWQSMDASKIDGLYAPDVVGFDVSAAPLSTDRANWTKLQQGFAAMKFDHLAITQSKNSDPRPWHLHLLIDWEPHQHRRDHQGSADPLHRRLPQAGR